MRTPLTTKGGGCHVVHDGPRRRRAVAEGGPTTGSLSTTKGDGCHAVPDGPRRRHVTAFALAALSCVLLIVAAHAAPQVYTPWPFDAAEAARRQAETAQALGVPVERTVDLPGGGKLTLILVPAGEFLMGAPATESPLGSDESPPFRVRVARPLWVSKYEITNQQLRLFRPQHDSRNIDTHWKDRVGPGPTLNGEQQPAVRLSLDTAEAFCDWLTKSTGQPFRLPSEPEWEYACRAGTDTPWGCPEASLSRCANFADASLGSLKPWALRDQSQNDGAAASADVGRYQPNSWGLCDMHGNVAEWCDSVYQPYPLSAKGPTEGERVVRGGSWDDRPRRVRSAFRQSYPGDYCVYNVGFRVVCEVENP